MATQPIHQDADAIYHVIVPVSRQNFTLKVFSIFVLLRVGIKTLYKMHKQEILDVSVVYKNGSPLSCLELTWSEWLSQTNKTVGGLINLHLFSIFL